MVTSRLYRARGVLKNRLDKMNIKGVLSLAMVTTVLSKILNLDAKASLTNSINTTNWQNLCTAMENSPESAQAVLPIIGKAVAAPVSKGIAVTIEPGTVAAISGKGVAIVLGAALAVGSLGYVIYHTYVNNGLNFEPFIIKKYKRYFCKMQ